MKGKIFLAILTIITLAFFTVVVLHACKSGGQEAEETISDPTSRTVHETTIVVDQRGEFKYHNGLIRIYPGDTVIWKCQKPERGPFTIHIGWDSPFEECSFYSENGDDIEAKLPKNAKPGYYRYMLAVLVNGKIYTDDPELIVKKPPREDGL